MYESPIRLLVQQLETNIREQQDKQIFEAIQKFGVDVDRDELIKALAYDRKQYGKGYADGRADASRWISVEERLPEDHKIVLIGYASNNFVDCGYLDTEEAEWCNYESIKVKTPTHWMPLPEPPKE